MEDLLTVVIETKDAPPRERREKLSAYSNRSGIGRMFTYALAGRETRAMLRAILDLSASPSVAEITAHYMEIHQDKLPSLVYADDAKTRKLAVQLLGKIAPLQYEDVLVDALQREAVDMVRPSVILALGNCRGSDKAYEALSSFIIPDCEEKHRREHQLALDKALSALGGMSVTASKCTVPKNRSIVLFCPNANVTLGQLRQKGYTAKLYHLLDHTVLVDGISDVVELYAIRSFYSLGILCGSFDRLEKACSYCQSNAFVSLVRESLGTDETTYRVESSGQSISHGDRKATAEQIALGLSRISHLRNSPSAYDFSIQILEGRRSFSVFLCPSGSFDGRFDYRQNAISASIHPAVAASVMAFAADYFNANASVLDCFCGSGTMLFERSFYPHHSLTGSDISAQALTAAKKNERRCKAGVLFLLKNATSPFRESFDEIICNMPFGIRVGSHDANVNMYQAFSLNLKRLLKPEGTALLFTNEKQLLAKVLQASFTIVEKASFSAGGLYPSLFIVRHKEV